MTSRLATQVSDILPQDFGSWEKYVESPDKFRNQSHEATQIVASAVCAHCLFSKPGSLPLY